MRYVIENDELKATIDSHGAELVSLIKKDTNEEYIWSGVRFWKRHSPVLFPFVGNVSDGKYRVGDETYEMGQHGFARDMEFECIHDEEPDKVLFKLTYNEETLKKYPYRFELEIAYVLIDNQLKVGWKVSNEEDEEMHFMIGAHPAFNCPPRKVGDWILTATDEDVEKNPTLKSEDRTGCFVNFHTDMPIKYNLCEGKLLVHFNIEMDAEDGYLEIDEHTFDRDALIIEHDQTHEVSLTNKEKEPFVTVKFEEPLVGIWSPTGADVPFVCIEPWFGRTDRVGFSGDISQREYEQSVSRGERFRSSYTIIV